MTWKPTMELRFVLMDHGRKLLQQRWIGFREFATTTGPAQPVMVETVESESEWRDVPLIDEEDSDDRAD